jgi:hypothetical protein
MGHAYPEVTHVICRVPSTSFSQAPKYSLLIHLCRFRVRSIRWSYFLDVPGCLPNPLRENSFRPPSLPAGHGILTVFPSTTLFSLALGAGSPCPDYPWTGNLGFSATEFLTLFIVTHVRILTCDTSRLPHGYPSQAYTTLRYHAIRHPKLR